MKYWVLLFLLPLQLFAQHLYIIHGRSGLIEGNRFVMHDVDHSVVYFSEAEDKRAGSVPLQEFLTKWELDKVFGKEGASAHYISYIAWKTHFNEVPVRLRHPRYNRADETLIFTIEGDKRKTEKLGEVALFLIH